jgi:hypothetical protein
MAIPSGVRQFKGEGESKSDKGSNHPADIGPGRQATSKIGGKVESPPSQSGGSAGKGPTVQHDGSKNLKGNYQCFQSKVKQPSGSGDVIPADAKRSDGVSVPRKRR